MRKIIAGLFLLLSSGLAHAANNPANIPAVQTIAQMQALGAASAQYPTIQVLGYNNVNDWGGGLFYWSPASTATIDHCTVFQASGVSVGRWIRQVSGDAISVEQCGAYRDGTNGAATVAAFQYAFDYIAGSSNPNGTIYALGASYATDNATTVTKASSFNCPKLIGAGNTATTYSFSPSTDKPAFEYIGGSGANCGGGITGINFTGNSHLIPLKVTNQGGMVNSYRVGTAKQAALLVSQGGGGFAEHNHFRLAVDDMVNCPNVIEYQTSGGTGSFKDSGLVEGTVISSSGSAGTAYIVLIGTGSQPYQIPLSLSFYASGGAYGLVNNNSSNAVSSHGELGIELTGTATLTLSSGASIILGGPINKLIGASAKFIYGTAAFATISGYSGSNVATNNAVVFSENATGVQQYLSAGTGATTVFNENFIVNRNATYYVTLAGPYDWAGIIDVFDNSAGTKYVSQRGNLFAGGGGPTFSEVGGALAVTVPDAITASTVTINYVKYIPNEFANN